MDLKHLDKVKRISVIGPGASGKSYLTKQLGKLLGLPVYHIDLHFWQRGWEKPPSKEAWLLEIEAETQKESWIIDGTYLDTLENRFKNSDLIIYLNIDTDVCVESAIKRHTIKRDDFPEYLQNQLPEDLDRLLDVINHWYPKNEEAVEELIDKFARGKYLRFRTRKEVDDFLETLLADKSNKK